MKILLLVPPLNFRSSIKELYNEYTCDGSLPPLGLMYISSILKESGFNNIIVDLAAVPTNVDSFRRLFLKEDPDVVGFSIIADSINTSMILAREIKNIKPECLVIAGGISPTFLFKEILVNSSDFDIIVKGEGEYTLLEIAKLHEKDQLTKKISQIKNIVYRTKSNKIKNNDGININKDLDKLPFPDRSASSFNYSYQFGKVQLSFKKFTTILTSRGCPFNCKFCACSAFSNGFYRERSPEKVLDEFELIYNQGYKQILITDDHFFVHPNRTIEILKGLKQRKIDMDIICESRVDYAKKDVLKQANKSGVKVIFYGMESGCQRILDYYNKKITISQIKNAVDKTRAAKINMIVGSFMYGAPGETIKDMMLTTKLILNLDIDVSILNIVDVLPGTELWFEAQRKGLLPKEAWRKTIHAADVFPNSISIPKIRKIIDKSYSLFINRGSWISKQIGRTLLNGWRIGLIYKNLRKTGIGNINRIVNEIASSDRMYKYQKKIST